jgi:hypothetical protein
MTPIRLREQLHQERPNLRTLMDRGEIMQIYLMREYWKRLQILASWRKIGEVP